MPFKGCSKTQQGKGFSGTLWPQPSKSSVRQIYSSEQLKSSENMSTLPTSLSRHYLLLDLLLFSPGRVVAHVSVWRGCYHAEVHQSESGNDLKHNGKE